MSIPNNIIQYKSCFNFKDVSSNPYTFFLEALSFSKLNLWKDSFSYDISGDKLKYNYKNIKNHNKTYKNHGLKKLRKEINSRKKTKAK